MRCYHVAWFLIGDPDVVSMCRPKTKCSCVASQKKQAQKSTCALENRSSSRNNCGTSDPDPGCHLGCLPLGDLSRRPGAQSAAPVRFSWIFFCWTFTRSLTKGNWGPPDPPPPPPTHSPPLPPTHQSILGGWLAALRVFRVNVIHIFSDPWNNCPFCRLAKTHETWTCGTFPPPPSP